MYASLYDFIRVNWGILETTKALRWKIAVNIAQGIIVLITC